MLFGSTVVVEVVSVVGAVPMEGVVVVARDVVADLGAVSAALQAPATKLKMARATDTFLTPMRRYSGEPGSPLPKLRIPTTLRLSTEVRAVGTAQITKYGR